MPRVPCSCLDYRTGFIPLGRVSGCGDRVCAILMSVASWLGCTRHPDPPVVDRGPARHVRVPEAKPDVIIQDQFSEGMQEKGWQSSTVDRLDPDLAPFPLVLCTAAISVVRDQTIAEKLRRLRVRAVRKPLDAAELLGVVAEVLAARQTAQGTAAEYPGR
jgi:CheY-like chemotaxis protein